MSKAENKAKEFLNKLASHTTLYNGTIDELEVYEPDDVICAYKEGYNQAEKDLLENEHEKSWRLDKKLWKGFKSIERASYQYMYDSSNDWAYDPTWEDVQDAFKAGAKWQKEQMMSKAIDFVIVDNNAISTEISTFPYVSLGTEGDTIKLIIIKQD